MVDGWSGIPGLMVVLVMGIKVVDDVAFTTEVPPSDVGRRVGGRKEEAVREARTGIGL